MTKNIIVINGSARNNNNTSKLVRHLLGEQIEIIELSESLVSHYNYNGVYPSADTFQSIVDLMLKADLIVLATPVYWYTMSGHMKAFLDRWTDLVSTHKQKGRALKGKKIAVISQSTSDEMPEGFEIPFQLTAEYMDMIYVGNLFWDMRKDLKDCSKAIAKNWL